jgi:hypothetical protein
MYKFLLSLVKSNLVNPHFDFCVLSSELNIFWTVDQKIYKDRAFAPS